MREAAAEGGFGVKIGPGETLARVPPAGYAAVHDWLSRLIDESDIGRNPGRYRNVSVSTQLAAGSAEGKAAMNRLFVVSNRVGPLNDDRDGRRTCRRHWRRLARARRRLVRLVGKDQRGRDVRAAADQDGRQRAARHRRHDARRHRGVLQRLRQPGAVAGLPLSHRSRELRPAIRGGLLAHQRADRAAGCVRCSSPTIWSGCTITISCRSARRSGPTDLPARSASSCTSPSRRRRSSPPFPTPSAWCDAMLAYDVIGFQTWTDRGNFARFLRIRAWRRSSSVAAGWRSGQSQVRADVFPIGIDADRFARLRQDDRGARPPRADPLAAASAQAHHRRRPARLFEGYSRALQGVRAHARRRSGEPRQGELSAGRAAVARRGERLRRASARARGARRQHQRHLRPARLDADPDHDARLLAQGPRRALSREPCRAGHAASRRHEPRRQGVCRGAGSRRIRAC